jgi:hypothetical protein
VKRSYLLLVPLLLISSPLSSQGVYNNYSDWVRMSDDNRAAYITGVVDSLTVYADSNAGRKAASHYLDCLVRTKITNGQLADQVEAYVTARPQLRGGTVQGALIGYLKELCGLPPQ